jgi:hypothetical protein
MGMPMENEYFNILRRFYDKSLILESPSEFHPVLHFYFLDAIAHIDYTLCILSFNFQSVRNIMNMQYMRWRIDEEKVGDRVHFPAFVNWLKEKHPERFAKLPTPWREIYDADTPAGYRSFRIVLDPNSTRPVPAQFFVRSIEEFFSRDFLNTIYTGASLASLFDEFVSTLEH